MAPSLRHLWRPIDSVLGKADHSEAAAGIPPWAWGEQLSLGNCIPLSVSLLINDKGGSLVVVGVPKTVFCKPFDLKNHYKGSWVERAVSLAMGRRMVYELMFTFIVNLTRFGVTAGAGGAHTCGCICKGDSRRFYADQGSYTQLILQPHARPFCETCLWLCSTDCWLFPPYSLVVILNPALTIHSD